MSIQRIIFTLILCLFLAHAVSFRINSLGSYLKPNMTGGKKIYENLILNKKSVQETSPRTHPTQLHANYRNNNNDVLQNQLLSFFKPTVTNILLWSNAIAYLISLQFPRFNFRYMKIDRLVTRGQKYRLFTSLFLHGSFYHLMTNSFSLYQLGPTAERMFGPYRYFLLYIGSGLLANATTYIFGTAPMSLGASGSIFGVLGALGAHLYLNKNVLGKRSEYMLHSIRNTVIMNLVYGASRGNIDNWAHFSGLFAGSILTFLFIPRLKPIDPFMAYQQTPTQGTRIYMNRLRNLFGLPPVKPKASIRDYGDLSED